MIKSYLKESKLKSSKAARIVERDIVFEQPSIFRKILNKNGKFRGDQQHKFLKIYYHTLQVLFCGNVSIVRHLMYKKYTEI